MTEQEQEQELEDKQKQNRPLKHVPQQVSWLFATRFVEPGQTHVSRPDVVGGITRDTFWVSQTGGR